MGHVLLRLRVQAMCAHTSVVRRGRTATDKATEASTTAIVDNEEAHDDYESHAEEYGTIVEVLSQAELYDDLVEPTTNALLVQLRHDRGRKVEATPTTRWTRAS